jgi:hypothetical protein
VNRNMGRTAYDWKKLLLCLSSRSRASKQLRLRKKA